MSSARSGVFLLFGLFTSFKSSSLLSLFVSKSVEENFEYFSYVDLLWVFRSINYNALFMVCSAMTMNSMKISKPL